jgi:hypothetical protein
MFLLVAENLCFFIVKMLQIWHCQPIVGIIDEPSPDDYQSTGVLTHMCKKNLTHLTTS